MLFIQEIEGNFNRALFFLDKALDIDPENVGILREKGFALEQLGDHASTELYYKQATEPRHQ